MPCSFFHVASGYLDARSAQGRAGNTKQDRGGAVRNKISAAERREDGRHEEFPTTPFSPVIVSNPSISCISVLHMHAQEDRLVVSVCLGSHGRESLGMNSSMQAMAGRCGPWGWTCALSATVGVVACISLPCNPINSNIIPENAAPLAAPKTHCVHVEFVRVFLLPAHRVLRAGARRRPGTNKWHQSHKTGPAPR